MELCLGINVHSTFVNKAVSGHSNAQTSQERLIVAQASRVERTATKVFLVDLCRLLDWAVSMATNVAAHQRSAATQGLQLAIQLGLSSKAMLNVLLDSSSGEGFFVAYQAPVQAWVLFNDDISCKALCKALHSQTQSRLAEIVLSGTLQMLQESRSTQDSRADPRQRYQPALSVNCICGPSIC